jgi:hypothetical protein
MYRYTFYCGAVAALFCLLEPEPEKLRNVYIIEFCTTAYKGPKETSQIRIGSRIKMMRLRDMLKLQRIFSNELFVKGTVMENKIVVQRQ